MPTPLDLSTELRAVNIILAGDGEQPVDDIEVITSPLVLQAHNALHEASRSIQTSGWYWNREDDWELPKDEDDKIPVPYNVLSISEVRCSGQEDLVQRGNFLYSRTNHRYTFDAEITSATVNAIVYLEWEELPEYAKQAIIYLAQRRFQMRELTSVQIDAAIKEDLDVALAELQHKEDEQGPQNRIDGSLRGQARRR